MAGEDETTRFGAAHAWLKRMRLVAKYYVDTLTMLLREREAAAVLAFAQGISEDRGWGPLHDDQRAYLVKRAKEWAK